MFLNLSVNLFTGEGVCVCVCVCVWLWVRRCTPPRHTHLLDTTTPVTHSPYYGQQEGSTHPTGMRSCLLDENNKRK